MVKENEESLKIAKYLEELRNIYKENNDLNNKNQELISHSLKYFKSLPKNEKDEYISELLSIINKDNNNEILGNQSDFIYKSNEFINEYNNKKMEF